MKELEGPIKDKILEGTEIRVEQEKKKEEKLIKQHRKVPGLTLWEYDRETSKLRKAKFKKQDAVIVTLEKEAKHLKKISHKVVTDPKCVYFQALNVKNAVKHLNKAGFKVVIYDGDN